MYTFELEVRIRAGVLAVSRDDVPEFKNRLTAGIQKALLEVLVDTEGVLVDISLSEPRPVVELPEEKKPA